MQTQRDIDAHTSPPTSLESFLADIEARAFRYALVAVRNPDDALDVVQDAMIALCRHYANRPGAEWRPLFFRILGNRVRDFNRRSSVRGRILSFFSRQDDGDGDARPDPIAAAPAGRDSDPCVRLAQDDAMTALSQALGTLPARQREAFMLRVFEDMDIAQTATAMGCSAGSVKTHHSRAVAKLRELLGEHR